MKVSELINDLITATLKNKNEDLELDIENLDEPIVVIHDGRVVITEAIHG